MPVCDDAALSVTALYRRYQDIATRAFAVLQKQAASNAQQGQKGGLRHVSQPLNQFIASQVYGVMLITVFMVQVSAVQYVPYIGIISVNPQQLADVHNVYVVLQKMSCMQTVTSKQIIITAYSVTCQLTESSQCQQSSASGLRACTRTMLHAQHVVDCAKVALAVLLRLSV